MNVLGVISEAQNTFPESFYDSGLYYKSLIGFNNPCCKLTLTQTNKMLEK